MIPFRDRDQDIKKKANEITEKPAKRDVSLQELTDSVFDLKKKVSSLTKGLDGDIKSSYQTQKQQWTPVVKGSTTAGTANYFQQTGYAYRQGILVDIWCDIHWDNQVGATGALYVELPYRVANSGFHPFVGAVEVSNMSIPANYGSYAIVAIPNTYRAELWMSSIAAGTFAAPFLCTYQNFGQILFSIRYLGVDDER